MEEQKQAEEAAQRIRTAAASSPKKKQKRKVMACQMCGEQKSCTKCYSLFLCSSCITTIGATKKRPESIRKIWQQFGPDNTPLSKSPAAPDAAIAAPICTPEWLTIPASPFSELLFRVAAIHEKEQEVPGRYLEFRRLGLTPLQGVMVNLADKYIQACNLVRRDKDSGIKPESLADMLLEVASCSLRALMVHNREKSSLQPAPRGSS